MLALHQTRAVIEDGIDRGLHSGLQLYVSRHCETLADFAVGESAPGIPLTSDALMLWMSAGKPLTAVAILMLVERGLLTLETPISAVIPEFGVAGKSEITLLHLLTHTGGFRQAEIHWPHSTWDEAIRAVCSAEREADWQVGITAGYHVATSWYVLGELIQRLDGRTAGQFVRDEIALKLGMHDTWNGIPKDEWARYGHRIAPMYLRDKGELQSHPWHDELHCGACSPASNTRGPVRELGRFYECLLAEGQINGQRLLKPETVDLLTRRHRVGQHDRTFQHVVDFGLGVIVDSKHYGPETIPYGYGPGCSASTFGHGGSQSSLGFADPEQGIVVAYVANCRPGEGWHQRRNRQLLTALWSDLDQELPRNG